LKSEYISKKSNFTGNIVSLLACTTEIICTLGLKDNIVGISHECDNPIEILDLPRISKPYININESSKNIDSSIVKSVINDLSIYNIDNNLLKSVQPDYIFIQDMCNGCAISANDLKIFFNEVANKNVQIISYSPNNLSEILHEIKSLGNILDCLDGVSRLITDMKIRLKIFKEENFKRNYFPTVAFIEWIEPIYFGGNWIPELIEYAGGKSVFGKVGEHSSIINFQEILNSDPDCILIAPCGFNISKTLSELTPFLNRPEWEYLKAVRNNNVFIMDGNKFFNRPGISIISSIEIIAEIIHPENFIYEFENTAWVRLKDNK
tara:strand:+ start:492 stop:1454 length:963 start_codon:yes stop_codon:yes gene_type:complete